MALEDTIQQLTDSVNELTATTKNLMALRADAIENVKSAGKPVSKVTKPAVKENISDTPEDRKDPAQYDKLKESITAFMGMDNDKDHRADRAALIKKLFGHDKIKAKKHTDVPEGMIQLVIKNIADKTNELTIEYEKSASQGDGDSDDLLG